MHVKAAERGPADEPSVTLRCCRVMVRKNVSARECRKLLPKIIRSCAVSGHTAKTSLNCFKNVHSAF